MLAEIKNTTKELKDEDEDLKKLKNENHLTKMELKIAKNLLTSCKRELKPAVNDALNAKKSINKYEKENKQMIEVESEQIKEIEHNSM